MKKGMLLGVVMLAGIAFWLWGGSKPVSEDAAAPAPSARSVDVMTAQVETKPIAPSLSLVGNVKAHQQINIESEVSARIETVHVKPGETVQKGAPLVTFNRAKAQAAVLEASAYLNDEQRKLKEYTKLAQRGALTQTELEAQQASVNIAKARLQSAQSDLDDHRLVAPFSGRIGLFDLSVGQRVDVGETLFSLDNLSRMNLDIQVPEQYFSRLYPQMPVTVTSQAWPDQAFTGKISVVDSRVNLDALSVSARVALNNPERKLQPGMLMEAKLTLPKQQAVIVPVQALQYSGTRRYVFRVDDEGIAHRTEITLGARIDNQVVVSKGLEPGQHIVVQGLVNMRDGAQVSVLNAERPKDQGDDQSRIDDTASETEAS
ncbi:efflux RND transporter periplasmic adaptor subunit [Salinivibrio sp. ES.052]|uniref:efflux RND transporter periplasmic adaptor subunit n=1 Tax=Salinivibrio sp. ES.052 TaxID=1882823 RepID=UPI000925F86C|nr:efflux RND transporter periplasmic adaptor subunit [Salinivibrio sp. ES.052]SIN96152.1 RND family efflux transporter, MFP subunit [Salinivibrio sp. ES.052]